VVSLGVEVIALGVKVAALGVNGKPGNKGNSLRNKFWMPWELVVTLGVKFGCPGNKGSSLGN